ncbi:hypothetical protein B7463_g1074, partial [Scytalidium lignicola]
MSPYPTPPPTISPKSRANLAHDSHTYFGPADEQLSPDSYDPPDAKSSFDPSQSQTEPRSQRDRTNTDQTYNSYVTASQGLPHSTHTDPSHISYVTAPQSNYMPPPQGEAHSYFNPSNPPTPDPNAAANATLAAAYFNPTPASPLIPDKPYVPPPQGEAHSYFNPSNAPTPVNIAPIPNTPPPFAAAKPPRSPRSNRPPSRPITPVVHSVPTPYNGSRPRPRRGFFRRMWRKFTKRLRRILEWAIKHPIKATLIAFLPAFLIGGIVKIIKSLSKGLEAGLKDILMGLGWDYSQSGRGKGDGKGSGGKGGGGSGGLRDEYAVEDYNTTNRRRVTKEEEIRRDVYIERDGYWADERDAKDTYNQRRYQEDEYIKAGYLPRIGFFSDQYDTKRANIPKGGYHVDVYGATVENTPRGALYADEYDVKEAYNPRGGYQADNYNLQEGGYGFGGGYHVNEIAVERDYKVVDKRRDENDYGYLDYGYEEYRDTRWEDFNDDNTKNNDWINDFDDRNNYNYNNTRNDDNDNDKQKPKDIDNDGNGNGNGNDRDQEQQDWFGGVFNDFKGFGGTKAGSIDGLTKIILMFM